MKDYSQKVSAYEKWESCSSGVPAFVIGGRQRTTGRSVHSDWKVKRSDHPTSFMNSIQNKECSYIMHGGVSMVSLTVFSLTPTFLTTPPVRGPGTLSSPARGYFYRMESWTSSLI